MSTRLENILVVGLILFIVAYALKTWDERRMATASKSNSEIWRWTDYRGFTYEIEVSRNVHE